VSSQRQKADSKSKTVVILNKKSRFQSKTSTIHAIFTSEIDRKESIPADSVFGKQNTHRILAYKIHEDTVDLQ